MAITRLEQKVFIIKKEAVRGTAEAAAAGGRSLPVLPASEANLIPALLQDGKIYGDPRMRPAQGGIREGSGTLELEPGADKLGELLYSLLGAVVTDQPDAGGAPLVYRHRFTKVDDQLHPLYTLFIDRKTHQKKYNGFAAKQLTFTVPVDGRLAVSSDCIFKSEAAGAALTPDFSTDLANLLFSDVSVEIAGAPSTSVRQASLVINTNAIAKRALAQTRDALDIIHGMLEVTGTFQMYFESDTERDKFLATTASSFKIIAAGQTLQAAQKATLTLDCPNIRYSAGPIAEADGILVQDFAFSAYLDAVAGYQARAELINKETAY